MRDFAQIKPQFWIGCTGKQIRACGGDCQLVALYVMSSPNSNMIGLYYLPISCISHEVGISEEGASKALASLSEVNFCHYDEATEFVWVVEMAAYQIAPELKREDKRVKGINNLYKSLPKNPFLYDFYSRYSACFHLDGPRSLEGASMPHRSKDKEKDNEKRLPNQDKILSM